MRMLLRAWLPIALCACAAPDKAPPAVGGAPVVSPEDVSESVIAIRPAGPAAQRYGDPRPIPAETPMGTEIVAAAQSVAAQRGLPALVPDGRLYAVAHDLARAMPQDTTLPASASEFLISHYGVIEPIPGQLIFWSGLDATSMPPTARERLTGLVVGGEYSRIGIATVPRDDTSACTVVLLLESSLEADPIPRRIDGGTSFRARILPRYRVPHVVVTDSQGAVRDVALVVQRAGRVRGRIECGGAHGRQQIELMAEDDTGPTVLANFPVWCDATPPLETVVKVYTGAVALSEAAVEQRLIILTNRARASAGLEPLRAHAPLAEVARSHSREMARTGVVAHTSPKTGTAADRVRAAGLATSVLRENVARAMGPDEAHNSLMNSPSHRGNILSDDATHIGVGVVRDPQSARVLLVTELFMRIPPVVDPREASAMLAGRIASARLGENATLASIATAQAVALAGGAPADAVAGDVAKRIAGAGEPFSRVRTIVSALARLESFDDAIVRRDRAMNHFGVGVAQGHHPTLGDNTIYVVVVVAAGGR